LGWESSTTNSSSSDEGENFVKTFEDLLNECVQA
jgi:hypothetical protein